MENMRQAATAQPAVQGQSAELEGQLAALVEHLVATCDHYAARYAQESLLLEDQQAQLAQAQDLVEMQQTELEQMQGLMAQQAQAVKEMKSDPKALDELAGMTVQLLLLGNQLAQALEQKDRQCSRQKIQIDYLNARNMRYQRLYQRITQTWYGKILLKIYHFMQKIGWISK